MPPSPQSPRNDHVTYLVLLVLELRRKTHVNQFLKHCFLVLTLLLLVLELLLLVAELLLLFVLELLLPSSSEPASKVELLLLLVAELLLLFFLELLLPSSSEPAPFSKVEPLAPICS